MWDTNKNFMKQIKNFLSGMIIGGLICMLVYGLTSCRTGYGCRGNQSWNHMVWRNNRP